MKVIAEFTSHSKDLFWKIRTPAGETIRWSGYDDDYWWYNVSKTPRFTDRKDADGTIWRLDPQTDEVKSISELAI